MTSSFASLLHAWRMERGFTQSALAARARVTRLTLSRWERGINRPSSMELESVLTALGATAEQRTSALRAVDAPRTQVRLRREGALPEIAEGMGAPVGGDLLRVMRRRAGKSQAEIAQAVGVRRSTVSRWEASETWPDTDQLHRVCWELKAHPREVAALTVGRFSPDALLTGTTTKAHSDAARLVAVEAQIERLRQDCHDRAGTALTDLVYLIHVAALWSLGGPRNPRVVPRLALVYANYARFLMDEGRLGEAEEYAHYALRIPTAHRSENEATWVTASLVLAERDVYGDGLAFEARRAMTVAPRAPGSLASPARRFHFLRGMRRLQSVADAGLTPGYHTWVLAHLARYCTGAGRDADALLLADRASAVLYRDEENRVDEIRARQRLQARILLRSGEPSRALETVPYLPLAEANPLRPGDAQGRTEETLIRISALLSLNSRQEVPDLLQQCQTMISHHHWPELATEMEALSRRL